ncbi:D-alanyl-D-alanine dipeptidase [Usitatibacter rugosus]|uniref:D-alanyl-D-alanine dipeptidase n=1 Tax=Usitatibacter rugosus TaxID=2732067 RepID=A0A6M4GTZ8_9PROT|nr:M15 family metallopeptidase [Usitatibacter rugosus]QJR10465.1 D-alanyl-D-alanine dipeptidase [Usitatibacter rugosus]
MKTLSIEHVPGHPDFRALSSIGGIGIDLRYASANNLVGSDLYAPFDCSWLHREGAERLEQAVAHLANQRPDLKLVVLDAVRPQRVQQRLWDRLEGTDLRMYFADPARGSIHSFGMAVDITLADRSNTELDMGTPFDDLTELSHPQREAAWLASGALTRAQLDNRMLLRDVMSRAGWQGISTEWWHFDGGDRERIRAEFARVL